jgi:hypothetical protein
MIEFRKLNNYANWTSKYCRPLYEIYCKNLDKIRSNIIANTPDIEIKGVIETTK